VKASAVIAAVRARGSDASDVRDAAHEAYHALQSRLRGKWTRARIHDAVRRQARRERVLGERSVLVHHEVYARAVEQLVAAKCGVDPGSVEQWALISVLEAAGSGIQIESIEWFIGKVRKAMESTSAKTVATRILALAEAAP